MGSHIGELASLGTAVCWTTNAVAFESAGKNVGSMAVNYLRLIFAFIMLSIFSFITRGLLFPTDASPNAWMWLFISGLLGFILGDAFLFQAFIDIGSRLSLLIMSVSPPITALIGYIFLNEKISYLGVLGIFVTMSGIAIVVLSKSPSETASRPHRPVKGIVFAFLGALGQSLGLIFSKLGVGDYNVFAATQIRLMAAIIGLTVTITIQAKWHVLKAAFKHKKAIGEIAVGSVTGPFIGVSLSLLAVQYTATGIVSALSSISPIIIIPASVFIFKEKVPFKEILGALISIAGIIILFI